MLTHKDKKVLSHQERSPPGTTTAWQSKKKKMEMAICPGGRVFTTLKKVFLLHLLE